MLKSKKNERRGVNTRLPKTVITEKGNPQAMSMGSDIRERKSCTCIKLLNQVRAVVYRVFIIGMSIACRSLKKRGSCMKIVWIGLLVACFELVEAGDNVLEDVNGMMLSSGDMWVGGKHYREGDTISDAPRSESFMATMLEQTQNRVAEDSEKQQKDLAILTSSYGDLIKNRWHALVRLLWCASGQEQAAQNRQAFSMSTAQPPVPRCYSCKQDPLCILNCCCCCLGIIGFCTAPCRSNE